MRGSRSASGSATSAELLLASPRLRLQRAGCSSAIITGSRDTRMTHPGVCHQHKTVYIPETAGPHPTRFTRQEDRAPGACPLKVAFVGSSSSGSTRARTCSSERLRRWCEGVLRSLSTSSATASKRLLFVLRGRPRRGPAVRHLRRMGRSARSCEERLGGKPTSSGSRTSASSEAASFSKRWPWALMPIVDRPRWSGPSSSRQAPASRCRWGPRGRDHRCRLRAALERLVA